MFERNYKFLLLRDFSRRQHLTSIMLKIQVFSIYNYILFKALLLAAQIHRFDMKAIDYPTPY